jgi:anti-sigma factor RsiW
MNCRESRLMIPSWLDHEVPEQDSETLQLHLKSCEACSALAAREAEFISALRERLPKEAMPLELKSRLLALAQARVIPSAAPKVWGRVLIGAGAGLLIGCLLFVFSSRPLVSGDWTQFYLSQYQSQLADKTPLDFVSPSPEQVAAWLQGSLNRPAHVPRMKDAKLLGGRICLLRGQRIGMAIYTSQGSTMNLFMGDPKLLCPQGLKESEGTLYAQYGGGLSLVAWEHHGHFHVAVSELKLAQLKELARQCQTSI